MKTVGAKGRQIFFSDKAKQNKVGAKERQVFFSGKAKQNKVGGKVWLGCPALLLEQKRDNRVTLFLQLYFSVSKCKRKRYGYTSLKVYFVKKKVGIWIFTIILGDISRNVLYLVAYFWDSLTKVANGSGLQSKIILSHKNILFNGSGLRMRKKTH